MLHSSSQSRALHLSEPCHGLHTGVQIRVGVAQPDGLACGSRLSFLLSGSKSRKTSYLYFHSV